MDYEVIQMLEEYIKNISNSKKKIIARGLVVDNDYQISAITIFGNKELIIQNKSTGEVYKLSNFLNAQCNCE